MSPKPLAVGYQRKVANRLPRCRTDRTLVGQKLKADG